MLPMPEHERLVEQRALERRCAGGAGAARQSAVVEERVERVAGDVRDRGGHVPVAPSATSGSSASAAEGALVDEAQLATVVGETRPAPRRWVSSAAVGRLHEQLAAHAEVPDQGERRGRRARARGTCRAGCTAATVRPASRSSRSAGSGRVPTDRSWVQHLGVERPCGRSPTGRDRGGRPRPRAARASGSAGSAPRRRRSARAAEPLPPSSSSAYAVAAASCSASFLLRPSPVAVELAADAHARPRTASAWSGPLSSTTYSGTPRPSAAHSSCS